MDSAQTSGGSVNATYPAPSAGTYAYKRRHNTQVIGGNSWGAVGEGSTCVTVTVSEAPTNLPPVADAGDDASGAEGSNLMLNGKGSSDPDGTIVTFAWEIVSFSNADGGTCQIAGTLHAAAFFAGLPILERSPHSRPSTYVWMGLDAVVVYPRLNLRFSNDLPFPIALAMTVEGGVVRAEIRGAEQSRLVSFVRRVEEVTPFRERTENDPALPAGLQLGEP